MDVPSLSMDVEETSVSIPRLTSEVTGPRTPETASSERSGSDGVVTPTESEKVIQTKTLCDRSVARENTSIGEHGTTMKNKEKVWYNVLPVVLQNFMLRNQEQIKQLKLPLCALCERAKFDKKAVRRCKQDGCILVNCSLCMVCWQSTHSSEGAKKHRHISISTCQQCQLDRIAYWCAECDLKFCQSCFQLIHSVSATSKHCKIATEDAPGTCLAASHWSSNFQKVICQMSLSRKQKLSGNDTNFSTNTKRKRDVEVIVIDDDDDEENESQVASNGVQAPSTPVNGTAKQGMDNNVCTVNHQLGSGTEAYFRRIAPNNTRCEAPPSINMMLEPTPIRTQTKSLFPALQISPAFRGSPSDTNTFHINTNAHNMQWNTSASQFGASSFVGNRTSSSSYAANLTSKTTMQVTPSSVPTSFDTTSRMWPTNAAISSSMSTAPNPNGFLPLGSSGFLENALVESLVNHYHEVNHKVTAMEHQREQIQSQIAIATCHGPYNAGPLMNILSTLQPVLEAAEERRDKFLIAMIIQSNDIMTAVRQLRLVELDDVPQVPLISHRKCLQLTNEINQHKTKLVELNKQLCDTLALSHGVCSNWENSFIRTISVNMKVHEHEIKSLKKAREMEFVRIVQFSFKIREALKQVFQRLSGTQRKQQQPPPSQCRPY
ncbi:hypothetical protein PsorP6_003421 [Peronosclerospora sorghi]|uniref:Uncharacterized protein n=1 Tax=Peronosclerospora sorghi TaxID=230839 RepID=A0ACC0VJ21_9STRA|nr:hypothetical protein PsorP6_003421 [Peronosclerospora sorghi]